MRPLIDKYQINPEMNKLFISICEMFDGKPNYQFWGVKMIFSKLLDYQTLSKIHDWVEKNQTMVKLLEKKNVVSYSSAPSIENLMKEMEALDKVAVIKNVISHFNTDQRKILTDGILPADLNGIKAYNSENVNKWGELLTKFSKLPMARKNNLYTVCSSIRTLGELYSMISNALEKRYEWNKEDMLAFLENNTKECEVVFNEGPHVIVRIGNFEASKKLCGGGRTQWCITKNKSYFDDYAGRHNNRDQYFYFDFSRKETDCFAHIGFTIECGRGLVYAQTCDNKDMRSGFKQGSETKTFNSIMDEIGVKMNLFMRLKDKFKFDWDIKSVLTEAKKHPQKYAIAYEKDGRLIVNVLNGTALNEFIGHTYINQSNFQISPTTKVYLLFDFNLPLNDEKSIIAMSYFKDQYGAMSFGKAQDVFGGDIKKGGYLSEIGITSSLFLNKEAIDPRILLHKYIDENEEMEAIKLIEKEGKNFDVNFEFNNRIPIFSAINFRMYNLFDKIINHPKWDSSLEDGFGETLLQSLIYLHGSDEIATSIEEEKNLKRLINSIISINTVDFNAKNLNSDTALNIACEYPKMVWIVEKLVKNKNVDVNVANDFNSTCLTNCIRTENIEALKLLGQRADLKVRETDKKLAKSYNINLSDYIKPNNNLFEETVHSEEEVFETVMASA